MPIDVMRHALISLEDAAKRFPRGTGHVQPQTVRRWATAGCRGVKLEVAPVGAMIYTTADALREFSARLTAVRTGDAPKTVICTDAHDAATEELRRDGFQV